MLAPEQTQPPRNDPQTRAIRNFIHDIGIQIVLQPIDIDTVLPGITIKNGALVVDETSPFEPGDLLHESGHLAIVPTNTRGSIGGTYGLAAEEMMSIGWSYAAARHLGLDPSVVFHAKGYRGGSQSLLDNFENDYFIGVPMLQWAGLTADPTRARALGVKPYPHMLRWVAE